MVFARRGSKVTEKAMLSAMNRVKLIERKNTKELMQMLVCCCAY